jgi:Zn-dependent protease with chaperone function
MQYSNPKIPEGINASQEHPLKEFFILTTGAIAAIVVIALLLGYFGGALARLVPFEQEVKWTQSVVDESSSRSELEQYLDSVSERVAKSMQLDDEFKINLRYSPDDVVNGFATLGGNIILFKGLLEILPSEDALAMLIAHEMAHIKHRDPIVSFGRSVSIQAGLAMLLGKSDASILGSAGIFTILHFSREMETEADIEAFAVIAKMYGHVGGASDLFGLIADVMKKEGVSQQPAIFSSHPLDDMRIATMETVATENGWTMEGKRTPLPTEFAQWLQESVEEEQEQEDTEGKKLAQ